DWLVRAIGHPVTWIGRLIGALDAAWNRDGDDARRRRLMGVLALLLIVAIARLAAFAAERLLLALPFGLVGVAILASSLLAQLSLYRRVAAGAAALERDGLAASRAAVGHIVGRDTAALDAAGVARAAIESLAENFSDGVVAPAFWMALAGLPGAAIYKAIN